MPQLKIIVAGSREFNDYPLLKQKLDFYCQRYSSDDIEIVSGAARGADRLGEKYAQDSSLSLKNFQLNPSSKPSFYMQVKDLLWDDDTQLQLQT